MHPAQAKTIVPAEQIAASSKNARKMPLIVSEVSQVAALVERVHEKAARVAHALAKLTASELDGLEVLRRIKFDPIGWHPIDEPARSLNLIEQVNQTWTCLVSLKALPFLFARHPDAGGFQLNLGTQGGTDILSVLPNVAAAEVFAAVAWRNNNKLAKELARLAQSKAKVRYVFFAAPGVRQGRQAALERDGIEVWAIDV
jgi:hypothetical protein